MASIDKIYGTEIQRDELYEWCEKNYPAALKWFYPWYAEWNSMEEHAITNFPTEVDCFLYDNCPIQWVKDAIYEQYGHDAPCDT